MAEREIISLRRDENGDFKIYADGELFETYTLDEKYPEIAEGLLPIKMWRAFKFVLNKRITQISNGDSGRKRSRLKIIPPEKVTYHSLGQEPGYSPYSPLLEETEMNKSKIDF